MEKNSLGKAGSIPFLFDALKGKSLFWMKTSVLKYYYFFILGLSASVFAQNYSISFGGHNGNIEFNDVTIASGDGISFKV